MFDVFSYVFSNVFDSVLNNTKLIDNIVNSVLNSDIVNDMVNTLEGMVNLNIDCKEYKRKYLIEADLPGVSKKDIDIDYTNNYISINIKRNQVFSNGKNVAVAVIQSGNDVSKDFYVENIDPYNIKAVFKDGHLSVYVPKKNRLKEISHIVEVSDYTCK